MEIANSKQQASSDNSLVEEVRRLRKQLSDMKAERDLLAFILDSIPDFVSYVDADLHYRFCNKIYSTESNLPLDAFVGNHVNTFMGEKGLAKVQPFVERALKGELVSYNTRADYRFRAQQDVEVIYTPHMASDESVKGFSVYVRNITAQRRAEETLRRQAQYDPLTELPNRLFFNQRLEQAIGRAQRANSRLAVLFIDLDGFKQVNDELGHDLGDHVLRDVARLLHRNLRRNDVLARIGGDEFVILIEDQEGGNQVESLADKVVSSVSSICTPALEKITIGASIGIAYYPDHAMDAREILIRADEAMYEAKRLGKNRYFIWLD